MTQFQNGVQDTLAQWQLALGQLRTENRLRQLRTLDSTQRPHAVLNGQPVVDFCSNDYLGLATHPALKQAAIEATHHYGSGTGGSRLIGGTCPLHLELETQLATFKGTPAARIFNSGYQANIGLLSALISRNDVILSDKLNHASLVDGAQLTRAKVIRYPHLNLETLETQLQQIPNGTRRWILTDSIFSMDGDLAPLKALYDLAEQYDAWLIIDEAHGTGVFGEAPASGLWKTTGLGHQDRVIQMGTFSKALGSFGAYVAGAQTVIDQLTQLARSFIYSTSLPPGVIAANLAALTLVSEDATPTHTLWQNIQTFQDCAKRTRLPLAPIQSPIIPIILGDCDQALQVSQALLEAGFYVQAIRPPTVPQGTARLRITLSAAHEPMDIERLVDSLRKHIAR